MYINNDYVFKIADRKTELDQVHKLNYKTFVEEIPQHEKNAEGCLVDKFHDENTYIIALDGDILAGMVAIRARRPFSLDQKIPDLDLYLPDNKRICEIRLLSVGKAYRKGYVFYGLLKRLVKYGLENNYNYAIISGTTRQMRLYEHIGFKPFYHLVGKEGAYYQPMFITVDLLKKGIGKLLEETEENITAKIVNLLPGPVEIHKEVKKEFAKPAVSHRDEIFKKDFLTTKKLLCKFLNSSEVEIFTGSGTLANEVVAGQLTGIGGYGVILSAGEFAERLEKIAQRHSLDFVVLRKDWGGVFTYDDIVDFLDKQDKEITWLWLTHCETSTGILNDLNMLKEICSERKIKLCLDCIGSVATVPINLSGVYLATCTSGKGIGSYPGLSMVFYHHAPAVSDRIPLYLDLGYYRLKNGIPFTIPSNLVYSLKKALELLLANNKFAGIAEVSSYLRKELNSLELNLINPEQNASPAVLTFALPGNISSKDFGLAMEKRNYLLSFNSDYLIEKNWAQVCIMGEVTINYLDGFISDLREALRELH